MKKRIAIEEGMLRQLVVDELKRLQEDIDHDGLKRVVNNASKLHQAVAKFKGDATAAMMNAVTPHLDAMMKSLEDMLHTPSSYTDKPKKEPKIVKLRATKDAE